MYSFSGVLIMLVKCFFKGSALDWSWARFVSKYRRSSRFVGVNIHLFVYHVCCYVPCWHFNSKYSCFQAPQRFAKIARVIRTIVRIHISMKRYLKEESNPTWSLLEMTLNLRNHFDKILSFRPTEQWVGIIVFFVSGWKIYYVCKSEYIFRQCVCTTNDVKLFIIRDYLLRFRVK